MLQLELDEVLRTTTSSQNDDSVDATSDQRRIEELVEAQRKVIQDKARLQSEVWALQQQLGLPVTRTSLYLISYCNRNNDAGKHYKQQTI
jgi:hypothetical protein